MNARVRGAFYLLVDTGMTSMTREEILKPRTPYEAEAELTENHEVSVPAEQASFDQTAPRTSFGLRRQRPQPLKQ